MSETVAEWKSRKRAQVERFKSKHANLTSDPGFDNNTKFVLVAKSGGSRLVIGQLERNEIGQGRIDLTDTEIEEWVSSLDAEKKL